MSENVRYLHSHSGLERELRYPKHLVLCDEEYKELFESSGIKISLLRYKGMRYCEVPTLLFVIKGGVFKNLYE